MRTRKTASPTLLPAAAQLLPGKAEMPRPGPALIFPEEAAEGQLPDIPVLRSSGPLQLGACGMPPPGLSCSPGRTHPAPGEGGAKSGVVCVDSYLISHNHQCEGRSAHRRGLGLRCCDESPSDRFGGPHSEKGTLLKMRAPVIYLGTFSPRKCRVGPGGQE